MIRANKIDRYWFLKKSNQIKKIDYDAIEGFLIIVLLFFIILFLKVVMSSYKDYHVKLDSSNTEKIVSQSVLVKDFLMKSGKNRLRENRIKDAYKEYTLAYNLAPNDIKLNQVFIETLSVLCKEDNKYCDKLDEVMYASIKN